MIFWLIVPVDPGDEDSWDFHEFRNKEECLTYIKKETGLFDIGAYFHVQTIHRDETREESRDEAGDNISDDEFNEYYPLFVESETLVEVEIDEEYQYFIPGTEPSVWDVFLDWSKKYKFSIVCEDYPALKEAIDNIFLRSRRCIGFKKDKVSTKTVDVFSSLKNYKLMADPYSEETYMFLHNYEKNEDLFDEGHKLESVPKGYASCGLSSIRRDGAIFIYSQIKQRRNLYILEGPKRKIRFMVSDRELKETGFSFEDVITTSLSVNAVIEKYGNCGLIYINLLLSGFSIKKENFSVIVHEINPTLLNLSEQISIKDFSHYIQSGEKFLLDEKFLEERIPNWVNELPRAFITNAEIELKNRPFGFGEQLFE